MKTPKPNDLEEPLVYGVPRWDRYQWRTFKQQSPQTQAILNESQELFSSFPGFSLEVFHRLYNPNPQLLEQVKPEHSWASKAHQELSQVHDFALLSKRCRGDRLMSGVAATAFCEKLLAELPASPEPLQDPQPLRQQVRGLKQILKRAEGTGKAVPPHIQELLEDLVEQGKRAVAHAQSYAQELDESHLRQTLRAACEQAGQAAESARGHLEAFSFGSGKGVGGVGGTLGDKLALAQRIQNSAKLQEIAKQAGRMKRIAAQKQRSKYKHARDEINSIESGAELSRLLPAELVKLATPELFGLFARSYIERGLLQYHLSGKEPQGRGPVVVCLDSSGSMAGEREIWSKAVALALLSIAVAQKRTCRLLHFTEFVERIDHFPAGLVDTNALLTSMEVFFDGGTDYEAPLCSALEAIQSEHSLKRADVVFITDGECRMGSAFVDTWQKARQEHEFTCYGVLLGMNDSCELRKVANPILPITDLSNESTTINSLFSL